MNFCWVTLPVADFKKSLEFYQPFIGFSFERAIKFINDFIKGVNDGQIPNGPVVENQFPFAYRPSTPARRILTSTNLSIKGPNTSDFSR